MLQVIGGNGGAPSLDQVLNANAATNTLFGYANPTSPFPGWQQPSPNTYTFTLPPQGWWNTLFGGGVIKEVANWIADLVMQGVAWMMHLVILLAVYFSNPNWLVDPVAKRLGVSFSLAYQNVFLRLLPFLVLAIGVYLVWQFLKAKHVKMLTAVVSTAFSGALLFIFFSYFSPIFQSVNNLSENADNQVSAAIESISSLHATTIYDAAWNIYVLEPWEIAQFGHGSNNLQDFDVSSVAVGETYTTDSGSTATIQSGDNWVTLFMQNTTASARQSLLNDMLKIPQPFAHTAWTSADVKNSNPYNNIVFLLVMFLLALPCLMFLAVMAFLLFGLEMAFLFMAFMGIFVMPLGFVPEVGWAFVLKWVKQAIGYVLLKLANVVYLSITFLLISIVMNTVSLTGDESTLVTGALMAALIFLGALIFRGPIFSTFVMPTIGRLKGDSGTTKGEDDGKQSSKWTEFTDRTRELLSKRFDGRGGSASAAGTLARTWNANRGGASGSSSTQGGSGSSRFGSAPGSASGGAAQGGSTSGRGSTSGGSANTGPSRGTTSGGSAATGPSSSGSHGSANTGASGGTTGNSPASGATGGGSGGSTNGGLPGATAGGHSTPGGHQPDGSTPTSSDNGSQASVSDPNAGGSVSPASSDPHEADEEQKPHVQEAFETAASSVGEHEHDAEIGTERRVQDPDGKADPKAAKEEGSSSAPGANAPKMDRSRDAEEDIQHPLEEAFAVPQPIAQEQEHVESTPVQTTTEPEQWVRSEVPLTSEGTIEEPTAHPLEEAFSVPQMSEKSFDKAAQPPSLNGVGTHATESVLGGRDEHKSHRDSMRDRQENTRADGETAPAKLEDGFSTPASASSSVGDAMSPFQQRTPTTGNQVETPVPQTKDESGRPEDKAGQPIHLHSSSESQEPLKVSEVQPPHTEASPAQGGNVVSLPSVSSTRTVRLRSNPQSNTQQSRGKPSKTVRRTGRKRVELGRRTPLDPDRPNRSGPKS